MQQACPASAPCAAPLHRRFACGLQAARRFWRPARRWRRTAGWLIGLLPSLTGLPALLALDPAQAFELTDVDALATQLARRPYQALPDDTTLQALSYDDYRQLRFRSEQALWAQGDLPFQVHFYPLGRGHTRALKMHEVVGNLVRAIDVPASAFRNDGPVALTPRPGAAGWRYNFALNQPGRADELAVFLGASYFRVLAAGLQYGLSARGLAIDTTGGGREEFPAFTQFWLARPAPGDTDARFWALLDSPRVTGAYAFRLRPGDLNGSPTTLEVQARLHLRAPVRQLGIAPLTSMFLAGENQPLPTDYRPEVHDSDGLQLASGSGEWLWRPLVNPPGVFVSSFQVPSLRGFGLMQRDRLWSHYEDLEARYDRRPSAWVQPLGDWGSGRVELLQYHAPDETHDNIGAYWVPSGAATPGTPLALAWRLYVGAGGLADPPGAWVTQSRRGQGYRATPAPANHLQFHIDFQGPSLTGLAADQVQAVASSPANVRGLRAIAQPHAEGGWRVTLDFDRLDTRQPTELRLFLRSGERVLTETWAYALPPEP